MVIHKASDGCYKLLYWISAISFGGLVAILFVQVVTRNLLNSTSSLLDELSKFIFVWIMYLGVAMAVYREKHIGIEFFIDHLKGKVKRFVIIFNTVMTAVFFAVLAVYGLRYTASTMNMISPIMHIALGLMYVCIAVSAIISILFCINRLILIAEKAKTEGI